ncbi:MAG: glycosyltransferase [Flavobacteriales bacterium]|nr:glycosyltransferase [Flavobacteriales bacterium]
MTPQLSVILVVWNNRSYIGRAIGNFISQECPQAELVIVDGASTDGTREEIERLAVGHPAIRWLSEPDKGQSDAMNKGIAMARADYISFLNVDDYYEPGTLNAVIPMITMPDAPAFLVGNCKVWDADGQLIYVNRPKKLRPWYILSGYSLPVNPSAYFYRKALHLEVGMYPEENHMNMDLEFIAKASLVTHIQYVDNDWGNFRVLPGTKTFTDNEAGMLGQRASMLFKSIRQRSPIHVQAMTMMMLMSIAITPALKIFWTRLSYPFKAVVWKWNHRNG